MRRPVYLTSSVKEACRLRIPVRHLPSRIPSSPSSIRTHGFDEVFLVNWEPNLTDGPTSARFAVVDFNADSRRWPPAEWDEKAAEIRPRTTSRRKSPSIVQFHQASVWALLQRTLALFEGRRRPWRRSRGPLKATG